MAFILASLATVTSRSQSGGFSSGPAAMRIRDPVRRISSAIRSSLRAGLTGAAIPAVCAARVAAKSWEVLGPQSVTASGRRTPRLARPLAIRVTVPASSV